MTRAPAKRAPKAKAASALAPQAATGSRLGCAKTTPPAELARLAPGALVPNPRNPRTHPPEQIERLVESLKRDGQTKPVLARRDNLMLIAGHGVTEAARRLALPEVAVLLWDVDQATADRVMLADNQFGDLSRNDKAMMAELLGEIDQADYLATGFGADEVAKLLAAFEGTIEVAEVETGDVADEFWINCRGPLALQAEVLARIKTLLGEYDQVTVELGTLGGL